MSDEQLVEEPTNDDEEYEEAYQFWLLVFGVVGAVVGFNVGAEVFGWSFWLNLVLGLVGFIAMAVVAYRFRQIIAKVGAVVILIAVIAAIVEGIRSA
ncbi:MAG: hypothetical protein AAF351_09415 [Pseudomonadota bacterium]